MFDIQNINFWYPGQNHPALKEVNLSIDAGEMLVLCGASGCGKTTLLRQLKPVLTPHGKKEGDILFKGESLASLEMKDQATAIGYVLQSPENQIVTDKVWHELAFGLESLGEKQEVIRLRVAEMASFFGIEDWFHRSVHHLSGGQKQLLNLAAVMVMQPEVLILDEPTAQLDPIAAVEFLETVQKINRELGVTVLLSEHRLEEVIPMADRLVLMEKGEVNLNLSQELLRKNNFTKKQKDYVTTTAMRIYGEVRSSERGMEYGPVTVKEGRQWLDTIQRQVSADLGKKHSNSLKNKENSLDNKENSLECQDLWFRYEKGGKDVLRSFNLSVKKGDFHCLLGGNGVGKSTFLLLAAKILEAYRGKFKRKDKRIALLPQNPKNLLVKKTLIEDLESMEIDGGPPSSQQITSMLEFMGLSDLTKAHPYDLSGGELQRAALAKILMISPDLLLLDEPTKGLDRPFKEALAKRLIALKDQGMTVLMVSHDIEFCARYSDTCSLIFDGQVVSTEPCYQFFAGNRFYTTAANRMARHVMPAAITEKDVIQGCKALFCP
ncbi:energy-coupling factor transport system ATP-binding protein [Tindallia californiensis]|uniref:Energy-coupling factor transport system ATP-binding protein n=1 Tax=Tindallia californiensis TaxID=159292 RepID=A0A1H3P968_9FIRM|nr:energy-coupling factor transport system ATP-binding protein [Tindallia californiensis]